MSRVISVASGKGGVGKTTIIVNLGVALTKLGWNVLLVDADFNTGNLGFHLGLKDFSKTLHEVLEGNLSVENTVYVHESGVKFLPASVKIGHINKFKSYSFEELILKLVGLFDFILIDCAPGLGAEFRKVLNVSDEVLLVTTPDTPSLVQSLKARKISQEAGVPVRGVIVNKFFDENYHNPLNVEEFLDVPVLGVVPFDKSFVKSLKEQQPLMNYDSNVSVKFLQLAAELTGDVVRINKDSGKGFLRKLYNLFFNGKI